MTHFQGVSLVLCSLFGAANKFRDRGEASAAIQNFQEQQTTLVFLAVLLTWETRPHSGPSVIG